MFLIKTWLPILKMINNLFPLYYFIPPQVSSTSFRPLGGIFHSVSHSAINHPHGECLFAACMAAFEAMIQVKSDAGKIAKVFQQGEQWEKDGHWRQHDGNDPGKHAVHAEYERIVQPAWRAKPLEQER